MSIVSTARAAAIFNVGQRTVREWVNTGRIRAERDNGRLLIDTSTLSAPNTWTKERTAAPTLGAYRGLIPTIARLGPASAANAYIRLIPYQRELLDAWCASKGIDSPSLYCDPAKLKRDIDPTP